MKNIYGALIVYLLAGMSVTASADFNVTVSGFIRQEMAFKTTSEENIWTQGGYQFNGKTVSNTFGNDITRKDFSTDNDWNLMATRAELDFQIGISDNWDAYVKVRSFYNGHNYDAEGNPQGNDFETPFFGDCGTMLEVCGEDYMVDLPSAYLDYNKGGLWLRFGNQQIAWGEALFFRVADVANGLDLRRHAIFDVAAEEYADERIASPGVRGSYRINEEWEIEGFGQMFSPSIVGNENTPYYLTPSSFQIQIEDGFNAVDDKWNFGLRLKGQLGDLGLQFFAVSRLNQDGVYAWTNSKVNPFEGNSDPALAGLGALLYDTPFELSDQGTYSAESWFTYAGASRVDPVTALDSAVNEFAASGLLGAFAVTGDPTGTCAAIAQNTDESCARYELDGFFDPSAGLGPLEGHLDRRYKREEIFGAGINYMFTAGPDSFLNQLLVRAEFSFTPNKIFTAPSLSRQYLEKDEYVASLIAEKYHRFSESFPSTYMVFEYMFKSESDLFGRHLSGMNPGADGTPDGASNFHAFAFAMQQPSPTLKWRTDLAILYDVEGGLWIQPGLRYKPSSAITIEAYANIFHSDGGNDDIIETVEFADEFGLRLGYQF